MILLARPKHCPECTRSLDLRGSVKVYSETVCDGRLVAKNGRLICEAAKDTVITHIECAECGYDLWDGYEEE